MGVFHPSATEDLAMDNKGIIDNVKALESAFSGEVGFFVDSDKAQLGLREDEIFPTASTIKVAIAISLAWMVDRGEANWDDQLILEDRHRVGGSGVLKVLGPELSLCLRDVAMLMIIQSDNTATNMALEVANRERVNSDLRALGFQTTELRMSVIDLDAIGDDISRFAVSTPRELGNMMGWLARGELVNPSVSSDVLDFLSHQQWLDQIPRFLPFNPYANEIGGDQDLWLGNKSGFFLGVRVDAGVIRTRSVSFGLAIMTRGCRDLTFSIDNEGSVMVGRTAEVIYQALVNDNASGTM